MSLPLDRYILLLLRQRWSDAGERRPLYDPEDYPKMVRQVISKTRRPRYGDPRVIAVELGLTVVCDDILGCYGEVTEGDEICYSCKGGERAWGLRIYHGIAHWILGNWYGEHEESDAWLLTIEMAVDAVRVLHLGPEIILEDQRYAPLWLPALYHRELLEAGDRQAAG